MKANSSLHYYDEVLLHIVTPIFGKLFDLSKLASTRSEAKYFPIDFTYIIDTDSHIDFKRICDSISPQDLARVEIILVDVKSPGLARNAGLEKIKKGWVSFWDADDVPKVSEFYEMVLNADRLALSVCAGSFEVLDSQGVTTRDFLLSEEKENALTEIGMNPGLWRFSFRREIIKDSRFTKHRMAEDQLFLSEIDFTIDDFFISRSFVYRYLINQPGQLTSNTDAIVDLLNVYAEMYRKLRRCTGPQDSMRILMFTRQIITGLKLLSIRKKFEVLRFFFLAIIMANGFRIQLLKSIFLILRVRKGQLSGI